MSLVKLGVTYVMRRSNIALENARDGKLATNWEGPYRVVHNTRTGAYALETLKNNKIPRTFNVANLCFVFSLMNTCVH